MLREPRTVSAMFTAEESIEEHAPLMPVFPEILMGVVALLHPVLLIVVLTLIFTNKARLPFGLLGIVVLFLVPVVGPLLVLNWNRLERKQQAAA